MYTGALNGVFSRKLMRSLLDSNSPAISKSLVDFMRDMGCETVGDGLRGLYDYLVKQHRCEYVYKNTLLSKKVYGRCSPRTNVALEELPVGGSIADFVVINGKGVVYEIKTDLDNLSRLDRQIADYYSVFDHVSIVCGSKSLPVVMNRYEGSPVGVVELTRQQRLSTKKEALSFRNALDVRCMFQMLRWSEREQIMRKLSVDIPHVPAVRRYEVCLEQLQSVDIDAVHSACLAALKGRVCLAEAERVPDLPFSLRLLGYVVGVTESQRERLQDNLLKPLMS